MTKLELNTKLAKLYEIKDSRCIVEEFNGIEPVLREIRLIDDSARMFDLMIEHNIVIFFEWITIEGENDKYYIARLKYVYGNTDIIYVKDHETQQAAARFAIAMALVKLALEKIGEV